MENNENVEKQTNSDIVSQSIPPANMPLTNMPPDGIPPEMTNQLAKLTAAVEKVTLDINTLKKNFDETPDLEDEVVRRKPKSVAKTKPDKKKDTHWVAVVTGQKKPVLHVSTKGRTRFGTENGASKSFCAKWRVLGMPDGLLDYCYDEGVVKFENRLGPVEE